MGGVITCFLVVATSNRVAWKIRIKNGSRMKMYVQLKDLEQICLKQVAGVYERCW